MKIINKKIIILGVLLSSFLFFNHITSAESYESSVGVSFTLNPTINVTVSGDLTIPNLTPGDYKDSNSITVAASSNSIAGYTLSSTVGSSTNTSTELRKDGVDATNKFSSITTNKASLSNFDDSTNTWGYSYSTDSGTTWQSGDITGTPATGYNGLPLYTSSNSIKLINSTTSGSSSVLFKIGARTTTNQIAGEYTNVINFIGVANPNPPIVYMQNATLADCGKDMVDSRDNTIYTTALINELCWMTKNLDLAGGTTITNLNSNIVADSYTLPISSTSGFSSGSVAYVYNSGRTDCSSPGCYSYYSYTAACAGDSPSFGNCNYDICPSGWRLPTKDDVDAMEDLFFNGPDFIAEPFLGVYSGIYGNGGIFYNGGILGNYWTSTTYDDSYAYRLYYDDVGTNVESYFKRSGYSVRCIKSS